MREVETKYNSLRHDNNAQENLVEEENVDRDMKHHLIGYTTPRRKG